jgi:hypothetical protein
MRSLKFSFYCDGQLIYTCDTKRVSDRYQCYLIDKQVEFVLKVEHIF